MQKFEHHSMKNSNAQHGNLNTQSNFPCGQQKRHCACRAGTCRGMSSLKATAHKPEPFNFKQRLQGKQLASYKKLFYAMAKMHIVVLSVRRLTLIQCPKIEFIWVVSSMVCKTCQIASYIALGGEIKLQTRQSKDTICAFPYDLCVLC